MKLLFTFICMLIVTQSFAQEKSWEKRYEAAAAEYYHNGRAMLVTTVVNAIGDFEDEHFTQVEDLSTQSEGIFKIVLVANNTMEVYHWAAFDNYDVQRIFEVALENTPVWVEPSVQYNFE